MKKIIIITVLIIIPATIFLFVNITKEKNIEVGLIVDLSGKNSALGISARNGLNMAIDEINSSDPGYVITLKTSDHESNPDIGRIKAAEMVEEGIDVIISPVMSGMAQPILDGVGDSNILVIGPTVSSVELLGIDDNFIRISAVSSLQGEYMAKEMIKNGQKNAVMIIDEKNRAYTMGVTKGLKKVLEKNSTINLKVFAFNNTAEIPQLVKKVIELEPDAIHFACSGIDCGNFAQLYDLKKPLPQLYGSSWVKVGDVAKYGGQRVEGMILADSYKSIHLKKEQQEFLDKYKRLFNRESNAPAVYFYEAMQLYNLAFQHVKTTDTEKIKEALINIDDFQGIYESFSIDEFGDAVKKLQLYRIVDGEYVAY